MHGSWPGSTPLSRRGAPSPGCYVRSDCLSRGRHVGAPCWWVTGPEQLLCRSRPGAAWVAHATDATVVGPPPPAPYKACAARRRREAGFSTAPSVAGTKPKEGRKGIEGWRTSRSWQDGRGDEREGRTAFLSRGRSAERTERGEPSKRRWNAGPPSHAQAGPHGQRAEPTAPPRARRPRTHPESQAKSIFLGWRCRWTRLRAPNRRSTMSRGGQWTHDNGNAPVLPLTKAWAHSWTPRAISISWSSQSPPSTTHPTASIWFTTVATVRAEIGQAFSCL